MEPDGAGGWACPWAAGWTAAQGTVKPAIINAPGIGQGGISVTTGASAATVTWTGPANGAGDTDQSGRFAVGRLPDGSYTVTASLPGCQPGQSSNVIMAIWPLQRAGSCGLPITGGGKQGGFND